MTLASAARTSAPRLLVVEDHDDVRELMQMALAAEGFSVEAVASAEQGLDRLAHHSYDLLLTDFRLPGHSGVWLVREAHRRGLLGTCGSVLITADPEVPGDQHIDVVLTKPIDWAAFIPNIAALLEACGQTPSAADQGASMDQNTIALVLYVTPASLACDRAVRALRAALDRADAAQVSLDVVDITRDSAAAARDRVIFTPTLVKRSPPPLVWVLGDLSRPHVLTDLLQMWGIVLKEEK